MSVWSKAGRVGACISLLMHGNVTGMETGKKNSLDFWSDESSSDSTSPWPTMAVDRTPEHPEGERLDHYHKTALDRGFSWYMPKNSDEMNRLYDFFGGAQFSAEGVNDVWKSILLNIDEEIIARCLDGDRYFIDKYLEYLDKFIELSASYPDARFTEFLHNSKNGLERCLWSSVINVAAYVNSDSEEDAKYTVESTRILHVVDRIDKAISKAEKRQAGFFDLFCDLHINTEYKQTPAFKSLLREVGKVVFGSDIKIDLH